MDDAATKSADQPAPPAKPKGAWGAILTTTPIVLTVLATVFAGLSSSEMTRSMYFRSLAAQQQSKAGDQWAFFQAKRIRGTSLEMTVELIRSLAHAGPFDPVKVQAVLAQISQALAKPGQPAGGANTSAAATKIASIQEKLKQLLENESVKKNLPYLTGTTLPKIESESLSDAGARADIDAVVKAIGRRQTESETTDLIRKLKDEDVEAAIRLAEQDADAFDKACDPVSDTIKKLRAVFAELNTAVPTFQPSAAPAGDSDGHLLRVSLLADSATGSFKTAALDFDARRYRQEAFYNRKTAELYEVRVRRSGFESDRHRERSKKFFYSMLVAQAGVTIASLAAAKAQRSMLWLLAALAGVTALGFFSYVYVTS